MTREICHLPFLPPRPLPPECEVRSTFPIVEAKRSPAFIATPTRFPTRGISRRQSGRKPPIRNVTRDEPILCILTKSRQILLRRSLSTSTTAIVPGARPHRLPILRWAALHRRCADKLNGRARRVTRPFSRDGKHTDLCVTSPPLTSGSTPLTSNARAPAPPAGSRERVPL